jgi:hypothetical protein
VNPLGAVRGLGGAALLIALWVSGRRKRKQHPEDDVPDGLAGGYPGASGEEEPGTVRRPALPGLTEEELGHLAPYVGQGLILAKEVVGLHEDPFLARGWESRPGAPEHLTPDDACVKWRTRVEAWLQAPREGAMAPPRLSASRTQISMADQPALSQSIYVARVLSEAAEGDEDRTLRVGRRYRLWLAPDQLGRHRHFTLVAARKVDRHGK